MSQCLVKCFTFELSIKILGSSEQIKETAQKSELASLEHASLWRCEEGRSDVSCVFIDLSSSHLAGRFIARTGLVITRVSYRVRAGAASGMSLSRACGGQRTIALCRDPATRHLDG